MPRIGRCTLCETFAQIAHRGVCVGCVLRHGAPAAAFARPRKDRDFAVICFDLLNARQRAMFLIFYGASPRAPRPVEAASVAEASAMRGRRSEFHPDFILPPRPEERGEDQERENVLGRARMLKPRTNDDAVAVTIGGTVILNLTHLTSAQGPEALLRAAVAQGRVMFIGIEAGKPEIVKILGRLDDAAAEAVAMIFGSRHRRRRGKARKRPRTVT